jgi:c-di-GMP-binding flagellar brake protein YcgR
VFKAAKSVFAAAAVLGLTASLVHAEDPKSIGLTLKGKSFTPAEITVPAGQDFMIELTNENEAPAEFESSDLQVEKIAPAKSTVVINIKALQPGSYDFVDEFQEDDAKGVIIAK